MKNVTLAALLAATALSTPAMAQTAPSAGDIAALKAQIDALQAKVTELEAQMTASKAAAAAAPAPAAAPAKAAAAAPSWKGAPLFEDKEKGWSFKPRGRIQYDAGYVENPGDLIPTRNLGFNSRVRRVRIGAEGTVPGGFGYKAEMDFANSTVGFGDVLLTYAPKDQPWSIAIGNQQSIQSLEQSTSSRFISFLERAQMNDAFNHTRRIGLAMGLHDKANVLRFDAGLFANHAIDASFSNDGWIGAARVTYSPKFMGGMLHLGANFQHREFQSNSGTTLSNSIGAASTNQQARYRARPFLQTTDVRFVDTGAFAAKNDDIYGVEIGGIFKSLHLAGEAQWTKVNAYSAGDTLSGLDAFPTATFLVPSGDPNFFSGYVEAGYFLTGETRGYKNGAWDRTKVLNPFSKGGWGALQFNARFDYLDLATDELKQGFTNNFTTGAFTPSVNLGRGGTQTGYQAGLIWIPEDYVRFLLQYTRTEVEGGPFAGTVRPTSTEPLDQRSYGVDSVALRAQVDF